MHYNRRKTPTHPKHDCSGFFDRKRLSNAKVPPCPPNVRRRKCYVNPVVDKLLELLERKPLWTRCALNAKAFIECLLIQGLNFITKFISKNPLCQINEKGILGEEGRLKNLLTVRSNVKSIVVYACSKKVACEILLFQACGGSALQHRRT